VCPPLFGTIAIIVVWTTVAAAASLLFVCLLVVFAGVFAVSIVQNTFAAAACLLSICFPVIFVFTSSVHFPLIVFVAALCVSTLGRKSTPWFGMVAMVLGIPYSDFIVATLLVHFLLIIFVCLPAPPFRMIAIIVMRTTLTAAASLLSVCLPVVFVGTSLVRFPLIVFVAALFVSMLCRKSTPWFGTVVMVLGIPYSDFIVATLSVRFPLIIFVCLPAPPFRMIAIILLIVFVCCLE
jgi:hypothetical protein